jgi:hypothetical protein
MPAAPGGLRLQLQRSNGRTDGPGFPDVARPRFDGPAYATPRIAGGGPRLQTPPEIKRRARRLERRPAEEGDPFAAGRQSDDRAPAPGRSLSSGRAKSAAPGARGRLRRSARSRPDCRGDRGSLAVTAGDIVDVEEQIAPGSGPRQAIAVAVTAGEGPVAYWCCPRNRRSRQSRQCRVNLAIAAGRSRS